MVSGGSECRNRISHDGHLYEEEESRPMQMIRFFYFNMDIETLGKYKNLNKRIIPPN